MKVLILLALIGASLAFTPNMEYKYQYEGRLGMGVPEIKNKITGVGIKAMITMQIQDTETAIIKLSNIEVGEYLGENGISVTNPLPIQYSPLSGQGRILEEPFKVFFKKNDNEVMVVPKADLEWILNIRKSIAQLFLIEPIRGNIRVSDLETQQAFTTYEPTLFGKCSVDYVIHPIREQRDALHQSHQSEDEYLMTRTINFDKCHDEQVRLMHTPIKNLTNITMNMFENVASRQSVVTAKLVRKQNNFLIKEENVQGYFSVHPFGVPTDKLMSITNQTLFLESENRISNRFDVPRSSRIVDTWYMEVASPFSAPRYPIPFVNYYGNREATYAPLMDVNVVTGIPFSPSYIQRFQNIIEKLMDEIAPLMFTVGPVPTGKIHPMNTHEGKLTTMLDTATRVVPGIDVQGLEHIFEKYYNDKSEVGQMKLKMFIDVCAASGASAPIKMLLNEMMRQRITPERITSIFVTFANSFIATPVLPDLLRFVKTLNIERHPIMTTNVLVNVATILKKVCITKETIPYQIYGKEQCDMNIITQELIPYLREMLEKTQESYQKRVVLRTLVNLEIPEVIDILTKIIKQHYDSTLKEVAILAFLKPEIREFVRKDAIFDILMPIVQNIHEDPVLRQHAIAVLVTCRPAVSWWQRLAVSTWREPSESVASFIYYLIKNNYHNTDPLYSHESKIAHFILPLTKPFPPTTTYSHMYSRYNPEMISSVYFNTIVMKDDVSSMPRTLYTELVSKMGGFNMPIVEAVFKSNKMSESVRKMMKDVPIMTPEWMFGEDQGMVRDISNKFGKSFGEEIVRDVPNRRYQEMFGDEKENEKESYFGNEYPLEDSTFILNLFQNLQFVAPLNSRTVPLPFNPESFDFVQTLMSGKNLQLSKFFNPTPVKVIIPTEIGLPFIGKLSTPTVQSAEGNIKFEFEGMKKPSFMNLIASQSLKIDIMTNYKLASKVVADFQTVLPWNEKIIASGVETLKSINLPLKMRMTLETQGSLKNISLDIIPTHEREFAGLYMHTIPYVARKSMWPGQLISEFEKFEPITIQEMEHGIHKNKIVFDKQYTGVDAAVLWEGDVPFTFTYGKILEHIRHPYKMVSKIVSPTTKMFATALAVNFETSETRTIHPSLAFTMPLFFEEENTPKMEKNQGTKEEGKAFVMTLLTTGTQSRFFESMYVKKLLSQDQTVTKSELFHKYVQQVPRMKPEVYCMKLETVEPTYYDMKTLLKQLTTTRNMDLSFSGKVGGGSSCSDDQLAVIKGSLKVSDKKKAVLIEELNRELNINRDSVVNNVVKMEDTHVFDQIYVTVAYKDNLPPFFTNMTYHVYDVMRGSQYPHIYNNYYNVRNAQGAINIEGDRYIDGTWNMRVELPTEDIIMDHFELPFIYKLKVLFFQDKIYETEKNVMGNKYTSHFF